MERKNIILLISGIIVISLIIYFNLSINGRWDASAVLIIALTVLIFMLIVLLLNDNLKTRFSKHSSNYLSQFQKTLFTGPILSITVAAISGYIGWNITQFLSRDKVSIQDIIIKHADTKIKLSLELQRSLNELYNGLLSDDFYQLPTSNSFKNDGYTERELLFYLKLFKDAIDNNNLIINDSTQRKFTSVKDSLINRDTSATNSFYHSRALTVQQLINLNHNIEGKLYVIIPEIVRQMNEHRNDYQINLILFNSGDKQAVVKWKGELNLNSKIINLSPKQHFYSPSYIDQYTLNTPGYYLGANIEQSANYQYIKSKEFQELDLEVNSKFNSTKDLDDSKEILSTKNKNANIIITDIAGKKISKDFLFELDYQDDLAEYLKDNFYKFGAASLL